MAVELQRIGYGQVERQHMAAPHNGQIYAQLPALDANGNAITQLENGQFLKYDYTNGKAWVGTANDGKEWFLVYNEEKLYDERRQNHKDFAMLAKDMSDGKIYPRLLRTFVGDIFTTNTFKGTKEGSESLVTVNGDNDKITISALAIGDYVVIGNDGWLVKYTKESGGPDIPATGIVFQVVPHFTQMGMEANKRPDYTLPDGQWAVKLQRIR